MRRSSCACCSPLPGIAYSRLASTTAPAARAGTRGRSRPAAVGAAMLRPDEMIRPSVIRNCSWIWSSSSRHPSAAEARVVPTRVLLKRTARHGRSVSVRSQSLPARVGGSPWMPLWIMSPRVRPPRLGLRSRPAADPAPTSCVTGVSGRARWVARRGGRTGPGTQIRTATGLWVRTPYLRKARSNPGGRCAGRSEFEGGRKGVSQSEQRGVRGRGSTWEREAIPAWRFNHAGRSEFEGAGAAGGAPGAGGRDGGDVRRGRRGGRGGGDAPDPLARMGVDVRGAVARCRSVRCGAGLARRGVLRRVRGRDGGRRHVAAPRRSASRRRPRGAAHGTASAR